MKGVLFLAFYILLILHSMGQSPDYFTLNGTITGKDSGKLYLIYTKGITRITDSAEIKNGKFKFSGTIDEPTKGELIDDIKVRRSGYKNYYSDFYLEPTTMFISLLNFHFEDAELSNSKTNDEYRLFKKELNPVFDQIYRLKNEANATQKIQKPLSDSLLRYNAITKINLFDFLERFPNSFIALNAIERLSYFAEFTADSIIILLNSLNPNIQKTFAAQRLNRLFTNHVNSAVGHQASDFTRRDANGNLITLSSYKGKYVLMDFWASWCLPCRKITPHIKELYEKYHSKGLEVIAISCDDKYSDWRNALQNDRMYSFINILSFSDDDMSFLKNDNRVGNASWNGELRKQFDLMPIPVQVLVNKEGIIIGRYGDFEILDRELK